MQTRSLLVLTLWALPLAAQDARNTLDPGSARRISRTAGLHVLDGRLWGGADSYKVRFDAGSFEFTPAFGRRAARNYPLTFRLESMGRGSTLAPLTLATPTFHDLRVEYDRGGALERYEVGVAGIEQSFVFDTLPEGAGDLVVRGRLATDMVVTQDGDGLLFSVAGIGSCRMGGVVGIDANGVRVRGNVRYAAGAVELSLPASFVEHAALPLTLDPPLGSAIGLNGPGGDDDQFPYAAYDVSTDRYLVIWTRVFSATDIDVQGQLLAHTGALAGSRLFIENSTAFEFEPQIAGCNQRNAFVVVYTRDGDIIGRTVSAATGAVSNSAVIAGGTASFQHFGAVSADASNALVVCTWQSDGDIALQAARVVVNTNLTLAPGAVHTFAVGGTARAIRPRITKSDGGSGRHAIVFQREFGSGADSDPHIIVVDSTGAPIITERSIDGSLRDDELPEVDGDGTNWIVAWQRASATNDHDVYAKSVTYDERLGVLIDNSLSTPIEAGVNDDEGTPGVIWLGDSALIGWADQASPGTANWDSVVRSVDLFLCTGCEGSYQVSQVVRTNGPVFGCSDRSGGRGVGTGFEQALLTWESSDTTAFNGDIFVRLWQTHDGIVTPQGGGCGDGGRNQATCARSPSANFTHRLRSSIPNAPVVFVVSGTQLFFPCGSCTLVPDPNGGIVLPLSSDAAGNAALLAPIPSGSPLVGVQLFTQWATVDLVSPACPLFSIELSNALRIVVDA